MDKNFIDPVESSLIIASVKDKTGLNFIEV